MAFACLPAARADAPAPHPSALRLPPDSSALRLPRHTCADAVTTKDAERADDRGGAKAEESATPMLRIETGMHTSLICGAAMDAARRYLATVSSDKTARVWDAASGKLIETLRPPIGDGDEGKLQDESKLLSVDEGKLQSVAVSPMGDTVACGCYGGPAGDGTCVYLFNRKTGAMVRRIGGTKGPVNALAFSRDGRFLAAGTGPRGGVTVFRTSDGGLVGEADDYVGDVCGLAFAPTDAEGAPQRLVATAADGIVRMYKVLETADVPLRLVLTADLAANSRSLLYTPGDERATPGEAVFSPDGSMIAVGDFAHPHVTILSGDDLSLVEEHTVKGLRSGCLTAVCWTADGRHLIGGGLTGDSMPSNNLYEWNVPGTVTSDDGEAVEAAPTTRPASASTVVALFARADGGLVYSACDLALGVFGVSATRPLQFHPLPHYFEDAGDLLVSRDGATFSVLRPASISPAGFSLSERHANPPGAHAPAVPVGPGAAEAPAAVGPGRGRLDPPIVARPGMDIGNWDHGATPSLNDQRVVLDPAATCLGRAIAPDEQSFVLATDNSLQCFNQDRRQLWTQALPADAEKVNISGNGKIVIAALADGTVRWYRMTDGSEICALFAHRATGRWVLWTPTGDYDCSAGGEGLFGWHVNRGKDRAADFLPGSHFHGTRYKPDLLPEPLDAVEP